MGLVKRKLLEEVRQKTENSNLIDFLNNLIDSEYLSGVALGIAKQVVSKGVNSMSEKQQQVIDKVVGKYTENLKCEMCMNVQVQTLTDYINIRETGICPSCEVEKEKFMK